MWPRVVAISSGSAWRKYSTDPSALTFRNGRTATVFNFVGESIELLFLSLNATKTPTAIRIKTGTTKRRYRRLMVLACCDASKRSRSRFRSSIVARRPASCLLYTSDAADERSSVDLGGR